MEQNGSKTLEIPCIENEKKEVEICNEMSVGTSDDPAAGEKKYVKQKKHRSKRKKPGFNEDMFKETSYYFKEGFRYVYPYSFTFTAYVKERWLDLKILDLYRKEFHLETEDYYRRAIKSGKIKVNNKIVNEEYILKKHDAIQTRSHRHEPPVLHEDIEFLWNDDEMVVINKPPSIPVHPCGRYRHNSLIFLLGKEHNLEGLRTVHRIDRLTSGVLMFAKTLAKANELIRELQDKQNIEKEYLARVVREFPEDEIVVNQPVLTESYQIGICRVSEDGKPCSTTFKRLSFNGKSSVVSCRPQTGRMHQIRVHLKWLGFPIVNDPIYNHPTAWGDKKENREISEVILELLNTRKDKAYEVGLSTDEQCHVKGTNSAGDNNCIDGSPRSKKVKMESAEMEGDVLSIDKSNVDCLPEDSFTTSKFVDSASHSTNNENSVVIENTNEEERTSYSCHDIGEEYVDSDCNDCKRTWKVPLQSEMLMYLHSWCYKGPGWEYKTSIPSWAKEEWNLD